MCLYPALTSSVTAQAENVVVVAAVGGGGWLPNVSHQQTKWISERELLRQLLHAATRRQKL